VLAEAPAPLLVCPAAAPHVLAPLPQCKPRVLPQARSEATTGAPAPAGATSQVRGRSARPTRSGSVRPARDGASGRGEARHAMGERLSACFD